MPDVETERAIPPELRVRLLALRDDMLRLERTFGAALDSVHDDQRTSARNLLHYIALRNHDLRVLQDELVRHGLSSLGRCEAHVLDNVNTVLHVVSHLDGGSFVEAAVAAPVDSGSGRAILAERATRLFGPLEGPRGVRIMVTMPSSAADDAQLVRELLANGMDCMRINCAHDGPKAWSRMIANLERARRELKRECRVLMDLAGPKLRTGRLRSGPAVLKCSPHRDAFGRVLAPARVWLCRGTGASAAPRPADATLPVEGGLLARLKVGDEIELTDASSATRRLRVVEKARGGAWAETSRTIHFAPGIELRRRGGGKHATGRVGPLPAHELKLSLERGDRLVLTAEDVPGREGRFGPDGERLEPAVIGCTLPEVVRDVRVGERILFDDGRIGGIVRDTHERYLEIEITHARDKGDSLGADKGINLPDSSLQLDALTAKDVVDLDFVARHADLVGYSFVRQPADVHRLQLELAKRGRPDLGLLLKIENQQAFEHLPSLLLSAMRSPLAGVMIARGDLAIECGWQRLAEVQEEILWICEAAHLPVVWATQVLENVAKVGVPSRAEITDAAMSVRAECVMLNKGPHILAAMRVLDDILSRMQGHQVKKRTMLRRLRIVDDLTASPVPVREAAAGDRCSRAVDAGK